MSISRKITEGAGSGGGSGTYVDDVFSTYLYTGDGADRDIVNGVDLAGEGGMVWLKSRTSTHSHTLYDTERGALQYIMSNATSAEATAPDGLKSFNSDGFTHGIHMGTQDVASWTFRKAPKFFDVVTYVGNDDQFHSVPHSLGCTVGTIIIKPTSRTGNWGVISRSGGSAGAAEYKYFNGQSSGLNSNAPSDTSNIYTESSGYLTSDQFQPNFLQSSNGPGANGNFNETGVEYVAYLFAHDDSEEGLIQCGSFSNGGTTVDLGWEPEFVLLKGYGIGGDWWMLDTQRGMNVNGNGTVQRLFSNKTDAESEQVNLLTPTPTGFVAGGALGTNQFIYMAIRRPNKPAEEFEPEELFAVAPKTATDPVHIAGFPTDFALYNTVTEVGSTQAASRLTGTHFMFTDQTAGEETTSTANKWDYMDGNRKGNSTPNPNQLQWMWRRQPGFMDVVAYEGVAGTQDIPHNLGVKPEMMWIKCRSNGNRPWLVYSSDLTKEKFLKLNEDSAASTYSPYWQDKEPTDKEFFVGHFDDTSQAGNDYIAYLFASVPGISKVGSYDGSDQQVNIDCGFTTGPRFVLIKCVNSAGDWAVWGSEGGLATNGFSNPYITLNTTAAQQAGSADSVYTALWGFYMARDTLFNKQGDKYIYMAIA